MKHDSLETSQPKTTFGPLVDLGMLVANTVVQLLTPTSTYRPSQEDRRPR